jgi:hypothetical protein
VLASGGAELEMWKPQSLSLWEMEQTYARTS